MLCLQRYIYFPKETNFLLVNITSFTFFKTPFAIIVAYQLRIFLPYFQSKSFVYYTLFHHLFTIVMMPKTNGAVGKHQWC